MEKMDINKITENQKFKEIIKNENLSEVFFTLLQDFVTEFSTEYNEQRELACRLYIYYLKYHYNLGHIDNIYEKALLNFVGFFSLSEDTFRFLLSQDIDLNYQGVDMYEIPATLKDSLALGLAKPSLMGQFLDIINPSKIEYFSNENYNLYTDTVHMNIVAGRIGESIKQFESPEYSLYSEYIKKLLEPKDNNDYHELSYNPNCDKASSLIKTTRVSLIPTELKRALLNTIIYSPKIKYLNKESLSDLKEILTEDEYNRFISYLTDKVNENEIAIYRVDKNTLLVDSLPDMVSKKLTYPENK